MLQAIIVALVLSSGVTKLDSSLYLGKSFHVQTTARAVATIDGGHILTFSVHNAGKKEVIVEFRKRLYRVKPKETVRLFSHQAGSFQERQEKLTVYTFNGTAWQKEGSGLVSVYK